MALAYTRLCVLCREYKPIKGSKRRKSGFCCGDCA
jgi:hypothetical protein